MNTSIFRTIFLRTALSIAAALSLSTASSSYAVPFPKVLHSNALTKGQLQKLIELGQSLPEKVCTELYCTTEIAPLYVSVAGGPNVNFQVTFRSASFPRNVSRVSESGEEINDLATRPVLLQGTARIRHAGDSGETAYDLPVAGTLFRDSVGHYISISTKRTRNLQTSSPSLITVRIPVQPLARQGIIKSRVAFASSRAFQKLRCGTEPVTSPLAANTTPDPVAKNVKTEAATTSVIFVATDFDSQFVTDLKCTGSQCNNKIISFINSATVFYENSLGITFSVKKQYGPTSISSSTTSKTILEAFTRLNNNSRSTLAVDLYQLFTGKTLASSVIGLAYFGVTCSNKPFANMLVQRVSDSIDPVTVAHEIGHTLNASHPATPEGGIMDATVSSTAPSAFSTRSLAEMRPYLDANYANCIGGVSTPSATATPAPTNTAVATATPVEGTPTPTPGPGTPTVTPTAGSTPSATPSPTPRSGKGGNSIGDGKPRTITLSPKLGSRGALTISATMADPAGCTLTLSAGANDAEVDPGTTISEIIPTSATTSWKADMPFRVKASTFGPEIFFFARRTCDGSVVEVSKFVGVRPSRVALKLNDKQKQAFKLIGKRAWINNLITRVTQQ